jgi:2-keto-3-deoxy-galactonokinase
VKALYEQALAECAGTGEDRAGVFAGFLRAQLEDIGAGGSLSKHPLDLVISGMASSSVGWRELPYAQAPFNLDGSKLRFEELKWNSPGWVGSTYLISGVATQHDIMRGEEMEILGLMSEPSLADARLQCLLILPGTHSKHIWIRDGSVVDFRTSMTGELFEVLGRHSLLRASVEVDEGPSSAVPASKELSARGQEAMKETSAILFGGKPLKPPTPTSSESVATGQPASPDAQQQVPTKSNAFREEQRRSFTEGVLWAKERGLAGGLFRVRTRTVLEHRPIRENTSFFSGLLIGAELRPLLEAHEKSPVILAAAGHLSAHYGAALDIMLAGSRPVLHLPPEQVARAIVAGHAIFLSNQKRTMFTEARK